MLKNVIKEELKVPGHIDYLGELRNFVTKTGKKHGFADGVVNAFKLSIDEAATNIIKHAYRDSEGFITMKIIVKKNSMTVILIDQGKFFDPVRIKDPDLKRYVDIGKKGGLGIFIMKKLIDEVDYRHTEEGNELRLTKYKDGDFKKKQSEEVTDVDVSLLSLSLKSRYSLIAAAILTLIIIFGYTFFYITESRQIINDVLTTEKSLSENISRSLIKPGESTAEWGGEIRSRINKIVNVDEQTAEINSIVIVDLENYWLDCIGKELTESTFKIPDESKNPFQGIYQYKLKNEDIEVYDVVSTIYVAENQKYGETHLLINKSFVDQRISEHHAKNLRLAILILLIGYMGITVLIYIVMNPFRKLSDWVKELGHGEVKDEIDFDTGDELGEIAKAFSEITVKFRKSQENVAEQERLQKEMQLAQDIQQTLLPSSVPQIEGYEIDSFYESAKEVGGDYYDFVEVDKDCLGIVVADVSGKGVPGSLIMTMIRTALRTEARGVKSASEVLARLNDFVEKDMKKGMFVTIFYVIIDSKRRRLNYASAGHNPMILYRQTTKKTYYLNPKGFPVGISLPDPDLFKKSIESDTIQLAEDDVLLIYTDGITEAMNSKRYLFGEERLLDTIRKYSHLTATPFVEKLTEEIHTFTEGFEQNDDITFLAIKETSSPEKIELHRAQEAHNFILNGKSIKEACENVGITTYAYYNKYKKIFEQEGVEAYSIDNTISLEAKHFSIEDKTKIYDIIKKHPEYGAKRISEELNTEIYGLTVINESRIYDELVRSRLNTRQLREAYLARSGKKKRMKPPGTPMLTLDGRIIIDKTKYEEYEEEPVEDVKTERSETTEKSKSHPIVKKPKVKEPGTSEDYEDDYYIESLIAVPLENLLEKKRKESGEKIKDKEETTIQDEELDTEKESEFDDTLFEEDVAEEPVADFVADDIVFDDLIEDESIVKPFDDMTDNKVITKELVEDLTEDDTIAEPIDNLIDDEALSESVDGLFDDELVADIDDLIEDESLEESIDDLIEEKTIDSKIEEDIVEEDFIDDLVEEENIYEFADNPIEGENSKTFDDTELGETSSEISTESTSDIELTEEHDDVPEEEIEEDIGLEHDFSFKDIWDDDVVESEEESTELGEVVNENQNITQLGDQDDKEFSFEELTGTDDEIATTSIFEEKNDNGANEDESLVAEESQFSFNDLVDEVEQEISFFDSGMELDEKTGEFINEDDPHSDDEEPILVKNKENVDKIDDFMKEKHLVVGIKYYKESNYEKAIEELQSVIEIYPDFKEVYRILGNAYFRNEMSEQAMEAYQQVKEIDPYDVDAYENVGVIYANRGEYSKAILEWEKLLEIDPNRKDIKTNVEKAKNILEKVNNKV